MLKKAHSHECSCYVSEDILAETRPDANVPIERHFRLIFYYGMHCKQDRSKPASGLAVKEGLDSSLLANSMPAMELIGASIVY